MISWKQCLKSSFWKAIVFWIKEAESAGLSYVFCPSSIFLIPAQHRKGQQPPWTSDLKATWYGWIGGQKEAGALRDEALSQSHATHPWLSWGSFSLDSNLCFHSRSPCCHLSRGSISRFKQQGPGEKKKTGAIDAFIEALISNKLNKLQPSSSLSRRKLLIWQLIGEFPMASN